MQRAIEEAGIPTIIIAALPPVVRQTGTPRAVAPLVPMGANAGGPHNVEQQTQIVKATLEQLVEIQTPGKIVPLPFCLLYTSPSPRDLSTSRMPSSA